MSTVRVTIDATKKKKIDDAVSAAERRANADAWMAGQIEKGFVSSEGVPLGLTNEDVLLLTGNFVLAREAAALDLPLPAVIDANGSSHQLGIDDLTAVMLEYGQHRAKLSADYQIQVSGE